MPISESKESQAQQTQQASSWKIQRANHHFQLCVVAFSGAGRHLGALSRHTATFPHLEKSFQKITILKKNSPIQI
uniref:Uncharacterized protein n=1 Tax=viral metagenome TaxID=1070528 RepID=A0A6C0BLL7_9ZZZZ